jgi:two-component system response regulator HydG
MYLREPIEPVTPGGGLPVPVKESSPVLNRRTLEAVLESLKSAAKSDEPVLLRGERGTLKDEAARVIHDLSGRTGPFVDVRAIEAANGALASALEKAKGGTVFVGGVEALDEPARNVLFRALDARELERGGEAAPVRLDCRIVVAFVDSVDGSAELRRRFPSFTITLPPLRDRREDIPRLARSILADIVREKGSSPRELSPLALEVLRRYSWPGNVRELREALLSAWEASGARRSLEPDHFPQAIRNATPTLDVLSIPIGTTIDEAERALIVRTIASTRGNKKVAAHLLGISRSALYAKLARLEIDL